MKMVELCDKILTTCSYEQVRKASNFSLKQLCSAIGATEAEAEGALQYLLTRHYLEHTGKTYVITPLGEAFVETGGFAGQKERDAKRRSNQTRRPRTSKTGKSISSGYKQFSPTNPCLSKDNNLDNHCRGGKCCSNITYQFNNKPNK